MHRGTASNKKYTTHQTAQQQTTEHQQSSAKTKVQPARNTRASIQKKLLSAVDVSGSLPTAKQSVSRSYPLQFLADFAGAVLHNERGKILEYRHIIKPPKYKFDWDYYFGNDIGRLAQGTTGRENGTNTIFFIHKGEIPNEQWKYVSYSMVVCNERTHI